MMNAKCPKCDWQPDDSTAWSCDQSCGQHFNSFKTGGVCPKCSKKWKYTQCLSCHLISLHKEWYYVEKEQNDKEELSVFYEFIHGKWGGKTAMSV